MSQRKKQIDWALVQKQTGLSTPELAQQVFMTAAKIAHNEAKANNTEHVPVVLNYLIDSGVEAELRVTFKKNNNH